MPVKNKLVPTSFALPEEVLDSLRKAAFERRESQASIVMEAVKLYLKLPPPPEPKLSAADRDKLTTFTEILQARAEDRIDANWAGFLEAIRGGVFNWLAMWKQAVSTEAKYSKKS